MGLAGSCVRLGAVHGRAGPGGGGCAAVDSWRIELLEIGGQGTRSLARLSAGDRTGSGAASTRAQPNLGTRAAPDGQHERAGCAPSLTRTSVASRGARLLPSP